MGFAGGNSGEALFFCFVVVRWFRLGVLNLPSRLVLLALVLMALSF